MLLPGSHFPGLKQDSSHSSAFICVILVQKETKSGTSHFTSHFWGISVEAGPCVGRYFPRISPHPGGSSRLSHSTGQEMRLSPGEGTWCQHCSQTQLIHLQVISTHSKGSDMSFPSKSMEEHPLVAAARTWEREVGSPFPVPLHPTEPGSTLVPCLAVPIRTPHSHIPFPAQDRGVC